MKKKQEGLPVEQIVEEALSGYSLVAVFMKIYEDELAFSKNPAKARAAVSEMKDLFPLWAFKDYYRAMRGPVKYDPKDLVKQDPGHPDWAPR